MGLIFAFVNGVFKYEGEYIMMKKKLMIAMLMAGLLVGAKTTSVYAVDQHFVLGDEAYTLPDGGREFDSSMHLEHDPGNDGYSFSHDLLYGVNDRLQLDLTLSRWSLTRVDAGGTSEVADLGTSAPSADSEGSGSQTDASWNSAGVGFGYTLSDPRKEAYGAALFGNVQIGDKVVVLEGMFAFEKITGPVTLLYNGGIDAEWTGDNLGNLNNQAGEINQFLGLSYTVGGGFSVGAEVLYEISLTEWSDPQNGVFLGPNVHFQNDRFFATAAVLWQLTNNSEFEDLQVGVRGGIRF